MALDRTALKRNNAFALPDETLLIDPASDMPETVSPVQEWQLTLDNASLRNDSSDVVNDVLQSTQGMVNTYSALAMDTLEKLGNFPTGTVPASNIQVGLPEPPPIDDVQASKPSRPDYQMPTVGDAPTMRGELISPSMQPVTRPTIVYPDAPGDELEWLENPYLSNLLDNLRIGLNNIIVNGGTGLGVAYETAIWDRAIARLDLPFEQKYTDAEHYYSSKMHVAPPGALISRLNMLLRERIQEEALISSDIAAKQLEIAHDHGKFCLDLAQKTEQMTISQKNDVETRALDAMKSTITLLYDKYKTAMAGIQIKADVYKTDVDAEGARVRSIGEHNKGLTDTLIAETDAWKARLTAEFGIVEEVIKMYVADMGGYKAEVDAGAVRLGALVDRFKAMVGAAEVQGQISLGEYEQLVKAILGEIQLRLSSQQEAGRISSQVAASALSAFNASASISDSTSRSKSYGESKSLSSSNSFGRSISNSLAMGYSMSESVGDSYSESYTYTNTGA
jgi:hypothetical protein